MATFTSNGSPITNPSPQYDIPIICNNGAIKVKDDELPLGYKRLLDISTSGDIRYISNVYLTGEDTLKFRFKAAPGNLIGAYNDADANDNYSFYNSTNSGASYTRYNGQTGGSSTYTGTEYSVTISPTGVTGIRNPSSFTPTEFTCSIPLCVFATSPTGSSHGNATIYGSIEVTGSQNLKLIPCERVSDGAIGYYETSNGEFLENQESGTPTTSGYDTSHLTEIYYDGTVETVQAHGKNLFNPATAILGSNYLADGTILDTLSNWRTGLIPIEAGKSYCFYGRKKSDNTISAYNRINWFDSNGDNISPRPSYTQDTAVIGTAPNNAVYAGLSCAPYNSSAAITQETFDSFNWTFAEGSTATDYEPYFEGTTATCQPLLSVGTYKDSQNITNGAVTRNVGIKVLTGTEIGWIKSTSYQGSFYLSGATAAWGTEIGASALCSHLIFKATGESYTSGKFFFDGSLNCWNPDFDSSTTVSTFTQWLADQYNAGTPVIVVYPLATPTTETVTGQTLTITQGTNIVTAEGSVDDLELEVSYKAYAEVTVEEIEAVNTDENVEVTIS